MLASILLVALGASDSGLHNVVGGASMMLAFFDFNDASYFLTFC